MNNEHIPNYYSAQVLYGYLTFHEYKIESNGIWKTVFSNLFHSIGFEEIMQMLLNKSPNVSAVDNDNSSALMYAAEKGIDANFPINTIGWLSCLLWTQFGIKSTTRHDIINKLLLGSEKIVEMLIAKKAKINTINRNAHSALDYAYNATGGKSISYSQE